MKILALETSSNACSVTLLNDEALICRHKILPQQHGNITLDWIREIISEADITLAQLTAVAYSCGPGSFTGIRIGAAIAQGIAIAHNIPLIAVPSLQVIAQGAYRLLHYTKVMVMLDARMGQVYCGFFLMDSETGLMQSLGEDRLLYPEEVRALIPTEHSWSLITDIPNYEHMLSGSSFEAVSVDFYPHSQDVMPLAIDRLKREKDFSLESMLPVYLRNEQSWKKNP